MLLHPGRPHDGGKAVLGDGRRDALHGLLRQGLPPATARGLACADVWLPPTDDGRQRMIMTGTSPLFSGPLIQRQTTSAPAPAPCGFHAFHVCRGSLCVSMTLDAPCWVSLLPSFLRTRRCATIWRKDFPWSRRTKMRATVKRDRRADPFTMAPPSRFPREVGGSTTTRDSAADTGALKGAPRRRGGLLPRRSCRSGRTELRHGRVGGASRVRLQKEPRLPRHAALLCGLLERFAMGLPVSVCPTHHGTEPRA